MKINKLTTKLIKPQTPTPPNVKNYHISFLDQHVAKKNIALVLYYQPKPGNDGRLELEESLSDTLVCFYPLAGRYIEADLAVDCSDQGVEFVEAEAPNARLADLVPQIDTRLLVPDQYFRLDEGADDPILSIQVTRFACGGCTVAISVSHRVFDVSSLDTFVSAWTSASYRRGEVEAIVPSFELASLLPHKDQKFGLDSKQCQGKEHKIIVRRLVFDKDALTRLKGGKTASRVRVVCAVIAKAMTGMDRKIHGRSRDFVVFQPINMRARTTAPSPTNACGNMSFGSFTRRVAADEAEGFGIGEFIDLIGDGVRKSIVDYAEILSPDRDGRDIIINNRIKNIKDVFKPETFVVSITDWSRFGFYEADFGWGKPVRTGIGPQQPRGNQTVLTRSEKGDGIEAWVHLNEEEMGWFEQDEEIKLFMT